MYYILPLFFILIKSAFPISLQNGIPLAQLNCQSEKKIFSGEEEKSEVEIRKIINPDHITKTQKKRKRKQFERLALKRGISKKTAQLARSFVFLKSVAQKEVNQPEYMLTFQEYWKRTMPPSKISDAKKFLKENYSALSIVEKKYKVEKEVIVALLLMETYFGKIQGKDNILDSLFTLSLTSHRPAFWEAELLTALSLIDKKNNFYNRETTGSWAGAVGMVQFIPSSFERFAKDGSGNGKIDTLHNKMDAFASAANYLKENGWQYKKPFFREIKKNFTQEELCEKAGMPFQGGILLIPDKKAGTPSFIVYNNYAVVLTWNRSLFFATTIGMVFNELKNAN